VRSHFVIDQSMISICDMEKCLEVKPESPGFYIDFSANHIIWYLSTEVKCSN
jgi:hypothetical protein